MKHVKQITNLSAIIILIGTTIGAGIFFKNQELFKQAQGNLWLVITSWCVAGIGILALGLSIVEMISASKSNKGTLEWFQNFLPSWMAKSAKNYVLMIFIPVTLFTMPLYSVSAIRDAGLELTGWQAWGVGIGIFLWISLISLYSLKAAEKFQWFLTFVTFLPIIILPILAFFNLGNEEVGSITQKSVASTKKGLLGLAPYMVIIGGIPAITFAFDGFYEVSSLKKDLKKPNAIGGIIALGVTIILAIYLFVTASFFVGSDNGSHTGIPFLKNIKWLSSFFSILISLSVLSVVNGFLLGSIEQVAAIHRYKQSILLILFVKFLNIFKIKIKDARVISWAYIFSITCSFFFIFGPIGIMLWNGNDYSDYTNGEGQLFTFADILVNYTSCFMFSLITLSIMGACVNRFTKKINVERKSYFWPSAIIASIIIFSGMIFQFITGFVDSTGFNGANAGDAIIKLSVFGIILFISIMAGILESRFWKKFHQKKPKQENLNLEKSTQKNLKKTT